MTTHDLQQRHGVGSRLVLRGTGNAQSAHLTLRRTSKCRKVLRIFGCWGLTGSFNLEKITPLLMAFELHRSSMVSDGRGDVIDGTIMTLNTLDPVQQSAATGTKNIQLVLAGPGSGKTTTLAGRFVHLVRQGVDRRRILALTFTKKAADEMKSRIATALNLPTAANMSVATFHGFSFRHLRSNPRLAGLSENFALWDTSQQRHVFSSRRMWWNEETDILDIIAGAKERLLNAAGLAAELGQDDEVLGRAVEFFRVYESALRDAGAIDFADMVPLLIGTMDKHPVYAAVITGAYDHVLVDEYQDINPGQVELTDRFVTAGVNLWAVGDDDQTLYAFRAADVRFILDFPRRYRDVQVHILDRNYRSAPQIVAAAKRLIGHNRARCEKDCKPVTEDAGEMVIRGYRTAEIEARQVAKGVFAATDCCPVPNRHGRTRTAASPASNADSL
jgi:ATP-dependent DNA helicase UvrD/PcrA